MTPAVLADCFRPPPLATSRVWSLWHLSWIVNPLTLRERSGQADLTQGRSAATQPRLVAHDDKPVYRLHHGRMRLTACLSRWGAAA